MVHPQRTSDEKRPGRGRQRINPREFATTGPITPETAANYLLHRGLRQDGGGDQRGVSRNHPRLAGPASGTVFTVLLQRAGGMYRCSRSVAADMEQWDRCQQCPDFDGCYKFSMAKLTL